MKMVYWLRCSSMGAFAVKCSLFCAVMCFLMNVLFRAELRQLSMNFIDGFQRNHRKQFTRVISNTFSWLFSSPNLRMLMCLLLVFPRRKMIWIVHTSYIFLNFFILTYIRQLIRDPRPYWINPGVQHFIDFCDLEYGSPSSHCWMALLAYEPILTHMNYKHRSHCKYIIVLFFAVLLPIGKMGLGAQSGDQVLFGITMSFISLVLFRYSLERNGLKLVKAIFAGETRKVVFRVAWLHAIVALLPVLLYEVNVEVRQFNDNYIRAIWISCEEYFNKYEIETKQAKIMALIHLVFGMAYGLVLIGWWNKKAHAKFIEMKPINPCTHAARIPRMTSIKKRLKKWERWLLGEYTYGKQGWMNFLRVMGLYGIIGYLPWYLLTELLESVLASFYWMYIMNVLGYNLTGFVLVAVVPRLAMKWKLLRFPKIMRTIIEEEEENLPCKLDQDIPETKEQRVVEFHQSVDSVVHQKEPSLAEEADIHQIQKRVNMHET